MITSFYEAAINRYNNSLLLEPDPEQLIPSMHVSEFNRTPLQTFYDQIHGVDPISFATVKDYIFKQGVLSLFPKAAALPVAKNINNTIVHGTIDASTKTDNYIIRTVLMEEYKAYTDNHLTHPFYTQANILAYLAEPESSRAKRKAMNILFVISDSTNPNEVFIQENVPLLGSKVIAEIITDFLKEASTALSEGVEPATCDQIINIFAQEPIRCKYFCNHSAYCHLKPKVTSNEKK